MKSRLVHLHEGEFLLGLVRGLALVLALALFLFFSEVRPFLVHDHILIATVIIYTLVRIYYFSYGPGNKWLAASIISFDVAFCCYLPFVTGGLHSPFLLFPFSAI